MADIVYRIEVTGLNGLSSGKSSKQKDEKNENEFTLKRVKSFSTPNVVKQLTSGDVKVTNLLASAGVALAKNTITNAIETIGLRTGDTYRQQEIQSNFNLLAKIGGSALSGLIVSGGNIYGAIIGAVIGAIDVAGDVIVEEYSANIKRQWDRNYSEEKQRIYGYASYGSNRTGGVLY
jgi:hypothetical protein